MKKILLVVLYLFIISACDFKDQDNNELNFKDKLEEFMISYTKDNGCDIDVAFRLYVLELCQDEVDLELDEFMKKIRE